MAVPPATAATAPSAAQAAAPAAWAAAAAAAGASGSPAAGGSFRPGASRRMRIWLDGVINLPLRPRFAQLLPERCPRMNSASREEVKVHIVEVEPDNRGGNQGRLPATYLRVGGRQDASGAVTFREDLGNRFVETYFAKDWRLRFEVHVGGTAPIAYAEIDSEDLARRREWRLLLSDPVTSEAVYSTTSRRLRCCARRADAADTPTVAGASAYNSEVLRATELSWSRGNVRCPSFLFVRTSLPDEDDATSAFGSVSQEPVRRSCSSVAPQLLQQQQQQQPLLHAHAAQTCRRDAGGVSVCGGGSRRPHAMLLTRGTRGDVQPFVALARGLVLHCGCKATVVTEICWKKFVKAARQGLPPGSLNFRPSGGDTMRKVNSSMSRFFLRHGQHSDSLQALIYSRSQVEFFPSEGCFYHWACEERPDFIVFSLTTMHISMILSETLEIPIVGFILQPTREIEPRTNPQTVVDDVFGPLREIIHGPAFVALLQQVMERIPSSETLNELRVSRGLAPCPPDFDTSSRIHTEMANQGVDMIVPISPLVLGEQADVLRQEGMTLTDFIFLRLGGEKLEPRVQDFIQRAHREKRKVVAMTFSSMPVGRKRMLQIAADICHNSLPPADPGQERHKPAVIACLAGQVDDEGEPSSLDLRRDVESLERAGRLLCLSHGVPFGALFPAVDAAILHGGLGVTSEALLAGIPVVTSGVLLMDQRYWAARIADLGCGSKGVPVEQLVAPSATAVEGARFQCLLNVASSSAVGGSGGSSADSGAANAALAALPSLPANTGAAVRFSMPAIPTLAVELVNQALDQRMEHLSEVPAMGAQSASTVGGVASALGAMATTPPTPPLPWAVKAKQLGSMLHEAHPDGDHDGVMRNARAVFEAGWARPSTVRNSYARGRGCARIAARQGYCFLMCLGSCAKWLICAQVPRCLGLHLRFATWCLCCGPLRACYLRALRGLSTTSRLGGVAVSEVLLPNDPMSFEAEEYMCAATMPADGKVFNDPCSKAEQPHLNHAPFQSDAISDE